MDDIVKKAMEKWPNVPNCYGWLLLDARGAWRMRDEHAQAENLPGDRLAHVALLAFINRNYASDARGCWYFQNGPQRVYVNLESTPYVARTDADGALLLHTGAPLGAIDGAWFTDTGALILQAELCVAQLDDRDLLQCLPRLRIDGEVADDNLLMQWLTGEANAAVTLQDGARQVPVARLVATEVPIHFGFVRVPVAEHT